MTQLDLGETSVIGLLRPPSPPPRLFPRQCTHLGEQGKVEALDEMRVLQVTSQVLGLLGVHLDELRQLIIIVRVQALPTLLGTVAVNPVLVLLLALLLLGRRLLPEKAVGTCGKAASDN